MNGVGVTVGDRENISRALSRFKKLVDQSGVLQRYKELQYFTKPSETARLERRSRFANSRYYSRKRKF